MKVALLIGIVFLCLRSRPQAPASPKEATAQTAGNSAVASKAPDFEKPEQFLWQIMFGANDGTQSMTLKFVAAVVFFGSQIALEFIKASK